MLLFILLTSVLLAVPALSAVNLARLTAEKRGAVGDIPKARDLTWIQSEIGLGVPPWNNMDSDIP